MHRRQSSPGRRQSAKPAEASAVRRAGVLRGGRPPTARLQHRSASRQKVASSGHRSISDSSISRGSTACLSVYRKVVGPFWLQCRLRRGNARNLYRETRARRPFRRPFCRQRRQREEKTGRQESSSGQGCRKFEEIQSQGIFSHCAARGWSTLRLRPRRSNLSGYDGWRVSVRKSIEGGVGVTESTPCARTVARGELWQFTSDCVCAGGRAARKFL